jgi:hypothetical protein
MTRTEPLASAFATSESKVFAARTLRVVSEGSVVVDDDRACDGLLNSWTLPNPVEPVLQFDGWLKLRVPPKLGFEVVVSAKQVGLIAD